MNVGRIDVQGYRRTLPEVHLHEAAGEHDGLEDDTSGVHGQFGKEALVEDGGNPPWKASVRHCIGAGRLQGNVLRADGRMAEMAVLNGENNSQKIKELITKKINLLT